MNITSTKIKNFRILYLLEFLDFYKLKSLFTNIEPPIS